MSKVTRNFQVTIPADVRQMHHIEVGDRLVFTLEEGRVELIKAQDNILDDVFGIFGKGASGVTYARRLRKEWKHRKTL